MMMIGYHRGGESLPDQCRLETEPTFWSNTHVDDGGMECHQQNTRAAFPKEAAVIKGGSALYPPGKGKVKVRL